MKNRIRAYKYFNSFDGAWEIAYKSVPKLSSTYDQTVRGYIDEKDAEFIVRALNAYKPNEYKKRAATQGVSNVKRSK